MGEHGATVKAYQGRKVVGGKRQHGCGGGGGRWRLGSLPRGLGQGAGQGPEALGQADRPAGGVVGGYSLSNSHGRTVRARCCWEENGKYKSAPLLVARPQGAADGAACAGAHVHVASLLLESGGAPVRGWGWGVEEGGVLGMGCKGGVALGMGCRGGGGGLGMGCRGGGVLGMECKGGGSLGMGCRGGGGGAQRVDQGRTCTGTAPSRCSP